jgi:hypothetical protein
MAHDEEELTNPGRGPLVGDFDDEDEGEGTEEVTQVDTLDDRVTSDHTPSGNPFGGLDDDTLIPG